MPEESEIEKTILIKKGKEKTAQTLSSSVLLDETQHQSPNIPLDEIEITLPSDRYTYLGMLGSGSMGQVIRVRDVQLNRTIAMKILHKHLLNTPLERRRFMEEAQIEAQLQHPGIVSVHETGTLPSGHIYFTMREIRGRSLKQLIQMRQNTREERNHILQYLLRVCEAVGFAHNKGVVHCDIKPSNIMIGAYGEVWLVDWGIARLIHIHDSELEPVALISVENSFSDDITGTPLYMSPEQAHGFNLEIKPTSDIYSLGVILYEILVGSRPYPNLPLNTLMTKVRNGDLLPFPKGHNEHEIPQDLISICQRSLSFSPVDRYQDGQDLANALESWLDGSENKRRALKMIEQGMHLEQQSIDMIKDIDAEEEKIYTMLQQLPEYADEQQRYPMWEREDALKQKKLSSSHLWTKAEHTLLSALQCSPDLPQAHDSLAKLYQRAHQRPEHEHERYRILKSLEHHVHALPHYYDKKPALLEYLSGFGWLTLHTSPCGANVFLERYEKHNRRKILVPVRNLGSTPLVRIKLPMGSYRLRITKEGYEDVLYPILIERNIHSDGCPPNTDEAHKIWLPPKGTLQPNERYVPAGYFQYGGNRNSRNTEKISSLWLNGFIIEAYPFSIQRYIGILNQGYKDGIPNLAALLPYSRSSSTEAMACFRQDEYGEFQLQPDPDGDLWELLWPIISLSYDQILEAINIYTQQTERSYRLPSEEEWEKAARGVDARLFPWGDFFQSTWTWCSSSAPSVHTPCSIYSYPIDKSPYDVMGMAGNVREATSKLLETSYVTRGGCWHSSGTYNQTNKRVRFRKEQLLGNIGFRLVRDLPI